MPEFIKRPDRDIKDPPSVSIIPEGNLTHFDFWLRVYHKKKESGKFFCFVEGWNFYYYAPDEETAFKKGVAFVKSYCNHFLVHNKKNGLKKFVLELHRLGFRPKGNPQAMPTLIRNKSIKARFNSTREIPNVFVGAKNFANKSSLKLEAV